MPILRKLTRAQKIAQMGDLRTSAANRGRSTVDPQGDLVADTRFEQEPLAGSLSGQQKLQKDRFRQAGGTRGTGFTSVNDFTSSNIQKSGIQTPKGFEFLDTAAPTPGENEDPKDFQIRQAQFERDQSIKQANAIAKETVGIRGEQENQKRAETSDFFRSQSQLSGIGGAGKTTNPEFTKLSDEQKRLNATLPPGQQVQQFVEFGEGDLSAKQIEARNQGIGVRITDEQRAAKFKASTPTTFIDPETGKQKKGGIEENLFRVKDLLDAKSSDTLNVREDGSYYLKDEEGEEVDPIKRAEAKVMKEADEARDNLNESFRIGSDSIKSQHTNKDGNLTTQGMVAMQKLQTEYNKKNKKLQENIDETLDATIRSEKRRQIEVDTRLGAIKADAEKPLTFAQEISKSKINRLNEIKATGVDDMVALAQVEREYKMMKDSPEKLELNNFISGLDASGIPIEGQYQAVYAKAGNDTGAAYDAMKTRYGEPRAKQLRAEFQKLNGNSESQIEQEDINADMTSLWTGEKTSAADVNAYMEKIEGFSDSFKKTQMNSVIASPNASPEVKDEMRALLKEDFEDETGAGGNLTFEQKINIPAIGKMLFGTRISDKETERVESIIRSPEAKDMDRFELIQKIMGFDVTENKELGDALASQILAASPEEGLAGFDMLGLSKLLNDGNTSGAIRKVENFTNAIAKKTEGNNFVSESFVQANIRKYNDVTDTINAIGERFGQGEVSGTIIEFLGRFKGDDAKKVGAELATAVAKMRNELLGSAVTPAEEAFLADAIPKETDTPEQIASKLDNLKQNALFELNSQRSVYGLPELTEGAILDKKLKEQLYLGAGSEKIQQEQPSSQVDDLFSLTIANEGSPTSHAVDTDLKGNQFQSHGSFQMNREAAGSFAKALGFKNIDPNSPEFAKEWDERTKDSDFAENEKIFIKRTHFDPQMQKLTQERYPEGLMNDPRFQQMVMDVSVNSGANTTLIIDALRGKNIKSVEEALQLITESRKRNIQGHSQQAALNKRFDRTQQSITA